MSARWRRPVANRVSIVLLGAVVLAAACLGWLALSSRLTSAGARIDRLQDARSALLERRSEALLAYATATDPRLLETRARALGFGPPDVTPIVVAAPRDPAPDRVGGALAVVVSALERAAEQGRALPSMSLAVTAPARATAADGAGGR